MMRKQLSTDEYRILVFHIHVLLSIAQDARSFAVHDRLVELDLMEQTLSQGSHTPQNGEAFNASFSAVMTFLGFPDPKDCTNQSAVSERRVLIEDLQHRENEVANLKSLLDFRDAQIEALCTVIKKSAEHMMRDMEVGLIPF
jgi:hypothetical protein